MDKKKSCIYLFQEKMKNYGLHFEKFISKKKSSVLQQQKWKGKKGVDSTDFDVKKNFNSHVFFKNERKTPQKHVKIA